MSTSTSLGQQATANTVIAYNNMIAPTFSQVNIKLNDALGANVSTIVYVEGINKYVFYRVFATTVSYAQTYTITGLPLLSSKTFTPYVSVSASLSTGTWGTIPLNGVNDVSFTVVGAVTNTLTAVVGNATPGVFAAGTAFAKVVITLTED